MPTLEPEEIETGLAKILTRGPIADQDLTSRISRLNERFRVYAACSPHAAWAPGLVLTKEMRNESEVYLPMNEIRRAFDRLFAIALKYEPFKPASAVHSAISWLDVLNRLQQFVSGANPGSMLERLMSDGNYRTEFLFSLFLPKNFGSGLARYPVQSLYLLNWLRKTGPTGLIRCLDAACGSGEGTFELALMLHNEGFRSESIEINGTTIEPLELFAAAHAMFPHNQIRQDRYRRRFRQIFTGPLKERILFRREDLGFSDEKPGEYSIILCNGLLGGPLLSDRTAVEKVVAGLCSRLRPGGILLAADRFHGGWKKRASGDIVGDMLSRCGLLTLPVGEGVCGVKGSRT
jgi:chemotaxis methyl-accepting protein methylase